MDYYLVLIILIIISSHLIIMTIGILFGYLVAKLNSQEKTQTPSDFFKQKHKNTKNTIDMDETKVVLNISTDGIEKKFDNIADEVATHNDTISSINKLKQMKGK